MAENFENTVLNDVNFQKISNLIKDKDSNFSKLVKIVEIEKNAFSGQMLDGIDFEDSDLSGFDFSNTSLRFCNFSKAKLKNTNLKNADFMFSKISSVQIQNFINANSKLVSTLDIIYSKSDNIKLDFKSNIILLDIILKKNNIKIEELQKFTHVSNRTFYLMLKDFREPDSNIVSGLINLSENYKFDYHDENNIRMIARNLSVFVPITQYSKPEPELKLHYGKVVEKKY